MASYYKKINGKDYDRAMLDMAKAGVEGQGDGRISLNDAKRIVKLIKDGGKITPIEKRTLQYILKKYKFTETALYHIEQALGKTSGAKEKKPGKAKPAAVAEKKTAVEKSPAAKAKVPAAEKPLPVEKLRTPDKAGIQAGEKKSVAKYILIILLLLLLIPAAYYLYTKYKAKSAEPGVQSYSEIKPGDQQKAAEEVSAALKKKSAEEAKPLERAEGKTLYTIKENDTLIKISVEHYGDYRKWELIWNHNKGVLKSPVLIYPGQVIELPETK